MIYFSVVPGVQDSAFSIEPVNFCTSILKVYVTSIRPLFEGAVPFRPHPHYLSRLAADALAADLSSLAWPATFLGAAAFFAGAAFFTGAFFADAGFAFGDVADFFAIVVRM